MVASKALSHMNLKLVKNLLNMKNVYPISAVVLH